MQARVGTLVYVLVCEWRDGKLRHCLRGGLARALPREFMQKRRGHILKPEAGRSGEWHLLDTPVSSVK